MLLFFWKLNLIESVQFCKTKSHIKKKNVSNISYYLMKEICSTFASQVNRFSAFIVRKMKQTDFYTIFAIWIVYCNVLTRLKAKIKNTFERKIVSRNIGCVFFIMWLNLFTTQKYIIFGKKDKIWVKQAIHLFGVCHI